MTFSPKLLDIGTEEDEEIYVDVPERTTTPKPVEAPVPTLPPLVPTPVKV